MTSRLLREVSSNAQPVVPERGTSGARCLQLASPPHPDPADMAEAQPASEQMPDEERVFQTASPPDESVPTPQTALQPAVQLAAGNTPTLPGSNPESVPTLAQEIIDMHFCREQTASRDPNYLSAHAVVTTKMRMILIDWFIDVVIRFQLHAATYFLAVDVVDRYLTVSPNVPRSQLQLVGITAVFIAAKYEEVWAPTADDCARITANTFTKAEVLTMERTILAALGFRLTVTTPYPPLAHLLDVSQAPTPVRHAAMYFLEHAVLDYGHLRFLPSQLASASLYLAHLLLQREPWPSGLQSYSRAQRVGDFIACARNLLAFVTATVDSPYQAIRRKYSRGSYSEVARLPLPDVATLQ